MFRFSLLIINRKSFLNLAFLYRPLCSNNRRPCFFIDCLALRNRALAIGLHKLQHHPFTKVSLQDLRSCWPLSLVFIQHLLHELPEFHAIGGRDRSGLVRHDFEH